MIFICTFLNVVILCLIVLSGQTVTHASHAVQHVVEGANVKNKCGSREECLDFINLAKNIERYDDMYEFMDYLIVNHYNNITLSDTERHLFTVAHTKRLETLRTPFQKIDYVEKPQLPFVVSYKMVLQNELFAFAMQIQDRIDSIILPHIDEKMPYDLVFYLKTKADYNHYISSFDESAKNAAINIYSYTTKLARSYLLATDLINLELALNFSVFCYEILKDTPQAIAIAKEAFDRGIESLDSIDDVFSQDTNQILQNLRDNLSFWTVDEVDPSNNN